VHPNRAARLVEVPFQGYVMAIDALVRPFLRVPLFEGLRPLQITEIARRADRIVYRPGEVIIKEHQEGDAAVLIISGDAVRVAGPVSGPAEPVPVGALVGEMAMLIETEHTSTVVARGTVRALRISRDELHAQMREDSSLADHFVRRISGRLSKISQELRRIDQTLAGGDSGPGRRPPTSSGGAPTGRESVYH
jgi:CRP-like cAMP-binding protein